MNAKLKNARVARGVTLKDAAAAVGTAAGNLSRIESGKQFPSAALARRIVGYYGVTMDDVFGSPNVSHGCAADTGKAA